MNGTILYDNSLELECYEKSETNKIEEISVDEKIKLHDLNLKVKEFKKNLQVINNELNSIDNYDEQASEPINFEKKFIKMIKKK